MIHKIKTAIFGAALLTVPLGILLLPRHTKAFYENRSLAKFPEFSINGLMEGQYFSQVEDFISDHLPAREFILKLETSKNILLGSPVVNNVIITPECLLPYHSGQAPYKPELLQAETSMLRDLNEYCKENGTKLLYVGVPEQRTALKEHYPEYLLSSGYPDRSMQRDFFSTLEQYGVDYLDMSEYLSSDYVHFYSITDHHFNLYGAYETYLRIMERLSIPALEDVSIEKVDTEFLGSLNRKLFGLYKSEDALYTYSTPESVPFERFDNGEQVESSVFDDENLCFYSYYMGGDIPETIIRTHRPGLKNALMIGDSFTNAIEVFFYQSFDETRSLDFRHYTEKTVYEYLEDYHPDVLVIVCDDLSYIRTEGNGNFSR